jgi:hypothetical protein
MSGLVRTIIIIIIIFVVFTIESLSEMGQARKRKNPKPRMPLINKVARIRTLFYRLITFVYSANI